HTSNCDSAATCTNTVGGFTCKCPTGQTGDGTACQCDLNGTFALRSTSSVKWDAVVINFGGFPVTVLDAGSATQVSWGIRHYTVTGSTLQMDSVPCGGTAPDICSTVLNQAYAQTIPNATWDSPNIPIATTTMTISDPDPGEALNTPLE